MLFTLIADIPGIGHVPSAACVALGIAGVRDSLHPEAFVWEKLSAHQGPVAAVCQECSESGRSCSGHLELWTSGNSSRDKTH